MWIQKEKLTKEVSREKVLDWVVIEGVLWVEVADEREEVETCIVQC
ncbi:MAG: hypothetical protein ABH914_04280 [Candidatus Omnitrophota bacterium]